MRRKSVPRARKIIPSHRVITEPPPLGSKARYRVEEAAAMIGISRAMLFQRMAQGRLTSIKDGKRTFVTDDEIRRYSLQSK
jgi:hypothetical protein